jgi:four helix bundle protein
MHPTRFAHHSLDAFAVVLDALRLGDAVARSLPRGYSKLADQLRRALLGAYLQFTEAAGRDGQDRKSRLRCARAEAGEPAAALEAAVALVLVAESKAQPIVVSLDRFCAMVTRLGDLGARR